MKKAQATIIVIIAVLVIIAVALIVLAVNSFNKSSGVTGNVVRNTQQSANQNQQPQPSPKVTLSATGFISLNSAMLTPPFYTNAFILDNSGIT